MDTFSVHLGGSDADPKPDAVYKVPSGTLASIHIIIGIERTDEYCGGGTSTRYVVDGTDGMKLLATVFEGGEDGDGHGAGVWLPTLNHEGALGFVNNYGIDTYNKNELFKNKIDSLAKTAQIDLKQLIILHNYDYGARRDEKGEPVIKGGQQQTEVYNDTTVLYKWDGKSLNKIKTLQNLRLSRY